MAHMVVADRFALDQLKHLCKAKLCEELNVDVVAKILSFAHDHHCSQLKTFGVDFAVANLRGMYFAVSRFMFSISILLLV